MACGACCERHRCRSKGFRAARLRIIAAGSLQRRQPQGLARGVRGTEPADTLRVANLNIQRVLPTRRLGMPGRFRKGSEVAG